MFFVVRCAIFSSFRRMYNNFVTFTPPQNLAKRKQYIHHIYRNCSFLSFVYRSKSCNHFHLGSYFSAEVLLSPVNGSWPLRIVSMEKVYFTEMQVGKLQQQFFYIYILVNVFTLFYTLMCFKMPFNFIYTRIQHDNSLYNNHIKWFWLITRRHMWRHGSLSEGSLHESVSHKLNAKGKQVTQP